MLKRGYPVKCPKCAVEFDPDMVPRWPRDNAETGVKLLIDTYRTWLETLRSEDYVKFMETRQAIIDGLSGEHV